MGLLFVLTSMGPEVSLMGRLDMVQALKITGRPNHPIFFFGFCWVFRRRVVHLNKAVWDARVFQRGVQLFRERLPKTGGSYHTVTCATNTRRTRTKFFEA